MGDAESSPSDRADAADAFIEAIDRADVNIAEALTVLERRAPGPNFAEIGTNLTKALAAARGSLTQAHKEAAVQAYDERRRAWVLALRAELAERLADLTDEERELVRVGWPIGVPSLRDDRFGGQHAERVRTLIDSIAIAGDAGDDEKASTGHPVPEGGEAVSSNPALDPPAPSSSPEAPPELADVDRLLARIGALPDDLEAECWAKLASEEYDLDNLPDHDIASVAFLIGEFEDRVPDDDVAEDLASKARAVATKGRDKGRVK